MNLHVGQFPDYRPRRLRSSPALRKLVCETRLDVEQLVLPLFARSGRKLRREIDAMPGVFQLSPDEVLREAARAHALGVPAVLLFGIPDKKDAKASGASAKNGIVQQTVRLLKKELPSLLVITDVCLCEYMEHGHCGIVSRGTGKLPVPKILNDPTLKILAQTALSHAEAGADIVAPSDMMDGRVAAIRAALDKNGFSDTPIMSYAAKFASAFYGPFREAAESAPQFGDRRSYQMDAANAREALREVALDIHEGADIVMVKPALAYLRRLQRQTGRTQEECWRFVIKYGIKAEVDHRRWREEELDEARELLTKYSVEEVAKRLKRSAKALRNALQRRQLRVREIRCDCFSLESLAQVLHVRRSEIVCWIEQGWLQATITKQANRASYRIMPEALSALYKNHLEDLLKRRIPNHSLFEAYVQYCFSPKHTTGEQLLEVRRDKREREAFAALHNGENSSQDDEEDEDGTFGA